MKLQTIIIFSMSMLVQFSFASNEKPAQISLADEVLTLQSAPGTRESILERILYAKAACAKARKQECPWKNATDVGIEGAIATQLAQATPARHEMLDAIQFVQSQLAGEMKCEGVAHSHAIDGILSEKISAEDQQKIIAEVVRLLSQDPEGLYKEYSNAPLTYTYETLVTKLGGMPEHTLVRVRTSEPSPLKGITYILFKRSASGQISEFNLRLKENRGINNYNKYYMNCSVTGR
jgi:hypothetical protein